MKTAGVKVLPALSTGETYTEPNFLLVQTMADDLGETHTDIEHVMTRAEGGPDDAWEIAAIATGALLSHDEGIEFAVGYAKAHDVPIVYCDNVAAPTDDD